MVQTQTNTKLKGSQICLAPTGPYLLVGIDEDLCGRQLLFGEDVMELFPRNPYPLRVAAVDHVDDGLPHLGRRSSTHRQQCPELNSLQGLAEQPMITLANVVAYFCKLKPRLIAAAACDMIAFISHQSGSRTHLCVGVVAPPVWSDARLTPCRQDLHLTSQEHSGWTSGCDRIKHRNCRKGGRCGGAHCIAHLDPKPGT